ncbi:restriction endonuclease subunit S [Alteromonas stellipolaris]|uniref:restriction endonuclease subunit S n=1 Tax=Alteromonas stellipolaris TaxID=233316 RepID=UPI0021179A56|nr:restriction endonuclease subunit S [Alteromonas stellipolaris]MCQ8848228.1 restriction endonuclease subunit S [Alteromonas stellipolaris]
MTSTWPLLKIKDYPIQIIDGDRGANYPNKSELLEAGHCLFLNTGNVTKSGFNFSNCVFVDEEKHNALRKGTLSRFDTILTTRGTIGNVAFFSNSIAFENIRINSGMLILRPDVEHLLPEFLYHLLRSEIFQKQAEQFMYGAAQPQLPITTLKHIFLPLPKISIQKKISTVLSSYDELMENNLKRIKLLEEMAQITYEEWFVRMKFAGYETAVFDDKTGLPEGWHDSKIEDLAEVTSSKRVFLSDYVEEGVNFYRGKEIILKSKNEDISEQLYISHSKYEELKKKFGVPQCGDILVTAVGTLGYPYQVAETDEAFYFKDGNLIWLRNIVSSHASNYLISLFQSHGFKSSLNNIAIGSSQKALTIKAIKAIKLLKPSDDILEKFDNLIEPTFNSRRNLLQQIKRLKEARDILLPRLMTGMIDIEKVELPEAMLQRLELPETEMTKT